MAAVVVHMGYPDSQDDMDQTAVAGHILDWTEVVDHNLDWTEVVGHNLDWMEIVHHSLDWKEVVADHMGWVERACTVVERHFHHRTWVEAHPHPGPILFPIMSTVTIISFHISQLFSPYLCWSRLQVPEWLGRS